MFSNNLPNKLVFVRELTTLFWLGVHLHIQVEHICGCQSFPGEPLGTSREPPPQMLTTVTPPKLLDLLSTLYPQRHRPPWSSKWVLQCHYGSCSGSAHLWVTEKQPIPFTNHYRNISIFKNLSLYWCVLIKYHLFNVLFNLLKVGSLHILVILPAPNSMSVHSRHTSTSAEGISENLFCG